MKSPLHPAWSAFSLVLVLLVTACSTQVMEDYSQRPYGHYISQINYSRRSEKLWQTPLPLRGSITQLRDIPITGFGRQRDAWVYLPPSYPSSTASYPVLYLMDGQNLFNDETSYAGE